MIQTLSNQSLIHGLLLWFPPGNPLTDGPSKCGWESPDLQYGEEHRALSQADHKSSRIYGINFKIEQKLQQKLQQYSTH